MENTMPNSMPRLAIAYHTIAQTMNAGSGSAHHNRADPAAARAVKTNSHGLRRPPESAMAPRIGASTATAMPLALAARPHNDWPRTLSPTIPSLK